MMVKVLVLNFKSWSSCFSYNAPLIFMHYLLLKASSGALAAVQSVRLSYHCSIDICITSFVCQLCACIQEQILATFYSKSYTLYRRNSSRAKLLHANLTIHCKFTKVLFLFIHSFIPDFTVYHPIACSIL